MLREHEWRFITQLISRIYCSTSYEDLCETVFQQTHVLIPFEFGVCFRTKREDNKGVLYQGVCSDPTKDLSGFLNGQYPKWSEFIMGNRSTVFQQSDLLLAEQWEKSRVYKEIWEPQGIYWGLFISIVKQDNPLALLGLFRKKQDGDFDKRDSFIISILHDALEGRLDQLANLQKVANMPDEEFIFKAAGYNLTAREIEVSYMISKNLDTQSICQELCISTSTLNKHLSSIFAKTHVKSRLQLFLLLRGS